jgi:hypothetical protein
VFSQYNGFPPLDPGAGHGSWNYEEDLMGGRWHVGDCGGGGAAVAVGALIAIGAVYMTARAVAAIPWWVWASITTVVVALIAGGIYLIAALWRHTEQRGTQIQAVFQQARAQERQQQLTVRPVRAAIEAPVVNHYHVHFHGAGEPSPARAQAREELQ